MTSDEMRRGPDGRRDEHLPESEVSTGGASTSGADDGSARRSRRRTSIFVLWALAAVAVVAAASVVIYRAIDDGDSPGSDEIRTGELRAADGGDAGDVPPGDAPPADGGDVPSGDDAPPADGDEQAAGDGALAEPAQAPTRDRLPDGADGTRLGDDAAVAEPAEAPAGDGLQDDARDGSGDGDRSGAAALASEDCATLVTFDRFALMICERSVPEGADGGGEAAPGDVTAGPEEGDGSTSTDPGLAGPFAMDTDALEEFFGPEVWGTDGVEALFGPDGLDLEGLGELFGPDGLAFGEGWTGSCELRVPGTPEPGARLFEFHCRPFTGNQAEQWGQLLDDLPSDPVSVMEETLRRTLGYACADGLDESSEDFEALQQLCSQLLEDLERGDPGTAASDDQPDGLPAEPPDPVEPQATAPGSDDPFGALLGDLLGGGEGEEAGGLGSLLEGLLGGGEGEEAGGLGSLLEGLLGGGEGEEAGGLGSLLEGLLGGGEGEEAGGLGSLLEGLLGGGEGGEGEEAGGLGSVLGGLLGLAELADGSETSLGVDALAGILKALAPELGPWIDLAQLFGLLDAWQDVASPDGLLPVPVETTTAV